MHPILDPHVKVAVVSGYSLRSMPMGCVDALENLAAVANKSVDEVVAQILTLAMPELTRQIEYELAVLAEKLQAEMDEKLKR